MEELEFARTLSLLSLLLSSGVSLPRALAAVSGLPGGKELKEFFRRIQHLPPEKFLMEVEGWKRKAFAALASFATVGGSGESLRQVAREIVASAAQEIRKKASLKALLLPAAGLLCVVAPVFLRILYALELVSLPNFLLPISMGVLFPLLLYLLLRVVWGKGKGGGPEALALPVILVFPSSAFLLLLSLFPFLGSLEKYRKKLLLEKNAPSFLLLVSTLPDPTHLSQVIRTVATAGIPGISEKMAEVLGEGKVLDPEKALERMSGPPAFRTAVRLVLEISRVGANAAEFLRNSALEMFEVMNTIEEEEAKLSREKYEFLGVALLAGPVLRMAEEMVEVPASPVILFFLSFLAYATAVFLPEKREEFWALLFLLSFSPITYLFGRL